MKKSLLLNFVTIVSLFAFASCADDNSDYVQPTVTIEGADEYGTRTLEFSNKVGSQQVEITANGDWFIRIPDDASWLTVTPSEVRLRTTRIGDGGCGTQRGFGVAHGDPCSRM